MSNEQIKYDIVFNTDRKALENLKRELDSIKKLAASNKIDFKGNGAEKTTAELNKIQNTASQVSLALEKCFNPKLNTFNFQHFSTILNRLGLSAEDIQKNFSHMGQEGKNAFRDLAGFLHTTNTELTKTETILDKATKTLLNAAKWSMAYGVVNNITNGLRSAWTYAVSLDSALNDIRIVTGKSYEDMEKFAKSANKAAKALKTSTMDYAKGSLIYYQQGLSDKEVTARTNVSAKVANVTGKSMQEVSELLTAVWNGFQVTADKTEEYVDKLAAVAAASAADLEELSIAMSRVSSSANAMGIDVDQLTAQIATIESITRQDAAAIGTALKTIYARMGDLAIGAEDEFGTALGDVSSKMRQMGIDVLDQQGNLRNMGIVIEEVAAKWQTWTRAQQQAAAIALAGKRQYNNLFALFENWDMYEANLGTSKNALGTLQKQQDTYTESSAAHIKEFAAAIEQLKDAFFNNKQMNAFIDLLKHLTNFFADFVDNIGGGLTVILTAVNMLGPALSKNLGRSLGGFLYTETGKKNIFKKDNINDYRDRATENVLKNFREAQSNDPVFKELVSIEQSRLKNAKFLTEEENNRYNEIIRENIELGKQNDLIKAAKQKLEQATNYLKENKRADLSKDFGFTKEEFDKLEEDQKRVVLTKARQGADLAGNLSGVILSEQFRLTTETFKGFNKKQQKAILSQVYPKKVLGDKDFKLTTETFKGFNKKQQEAILSQVDPKKVLDVKVPNLTAKDFEGYGEEKQKAILEEFQRTNPNYFRKRFKKFSPEFQNKILSRVDPKLTAETFKGYGEEKQKAILEKFQRTNPNFFINWFKKNSPESQNNILSQVDPKKFLDEKSFKLPNLTAETFKGLGKEKQNEILSQVDLNKVLDKKLFKDFKLTAKIFEGLEKEKQNEILSSVNSKALREILGEDIVQSKKFDFTTEAFNKLTQEQQKAILEEAKKRANVNGVFSGLTLSGDFDFTREAFNKLDPKQQEILMANAAKGKDVFSAALGKADLYDQIKANPKAFGSFISVNGLTDDAPKRGVFKVVDNLIKSGYLSEEQIKTLEEKRSAVFKARQGKDRYNSLSGDKEVVKATDDLVKNIKELSEDGVEAMDHIKEGMGDLAINTEDADIKAKALKKELNEMDKKVKFQKAIEGISALVSGFIAVINIVQTLINLTEKLTDENASTGDKWKAAFSAVVPLIMTIISIIQLLGQTGMLAGLKIQLGFWPLLAITAALVVVMVSLTAIFSAFAKKQETALEKANKEYEKSNKRLEELQENLKKVKEGYDNLVSSIERFKSASEAIDDLRVNTDEWREAIKKANDEAINLITSYTSLAEGVKIENGVVTISGDALERVKEEEAAKVAAAEQRTLFQQIDKQQKYGDVIVTNFAADYARFSKLVKSAATDVAEDYYLDVAKTWLSKAIKAAASAESADDYLASEDFAYLVSTLELTGDELTTLKQEIRTNADAVRANTTAVELMKTSYYEGFLKEKFGETYERAANRDALVAATKMIVENSDVVYNENSAQNFRNNNQFKRDLLQGLGLGSDLAAKVKVLWGNTVTYVTGDGEETTINLADAEKIANQAANERLSGEAIKRVQGAINTLENNGLSYLYGYAGDGDTADLGKLTSGQLSQIGSTVNSDEAWKTYIKNLGIEEEDFKEFSGMDFGQLREALTKNYIDTVNSANSERQKIFNYSGYGVANLSSEGDLKNVRKGAENFYNSMGMGTSTNYVKFLNTLGADEAATVAEIAAGINFNEFGSWNTFLTMLEEQGIRLNENDGAYKAFMESVANGNNIVAQALKDFTSFAEKLKEINEITKDIDIGSVISEEEYKNLVKYNSALKNMFVLTADGYMMVSGSAEEINEQAKAGFNNLKDVKTYYEGLAGVQEKFKKDGEVQFAYSSKSTGTTLTDSVNKIKDATGAGFNNILEMAGLSEEAFNDAVNAGNNRTATQDKQLQGVISAAESIAYGDYSPEAISQLYFTKGGFGAFKSYSDVQKSTEFNGLTDEEQDKIQKSWLSYYAEEFGISFETLNSLFTEHKNTIIQNLAALDTYQSKLDKLTSQMEGLSGQKLIDNLEKQNGVLNGVLQTYNDIIEEQEKQLNIADKEFKTYEEYAKYYEENRATMSDSDKKLWDEFLENILKAEEISNNVFDNNITRIQTLWDTNAEKAKAAIDEMLNAASDADYGKIFELWTSGWDKINQACEDYIDNLEFIGELYKKQLSLDKIIGRGKYQSNTEIDKYFDAQEASLFDSIAANQVMYNNALERYQNAVNEEDRKAAYAQLTAAANSLIASAQAYYDTLIENFKEEVSVLYERAGITAASEDWTRTKEKQERYLTPVDEQYNLNLLRRNYQSAIDSADSLNAQTALRVKMEEELNKLQEKRGKLTQYEVDRANAVYELTLKQIALEESQRNASKMRLTRDANGNLTYAFAQDTDATIKAQEEVEAAQKAVFDLDQGQANNLIEQFYSLNERAAEALASAQTEEDFNKTKDLFYGTDGLVTAVFEQIKEVMPNLADSFGAMVPGANISDFYTYKELNNISGMEGNIDTLVKNVESSFKELDKDLTDLGPKIEALKTEIGNLITALKPEEPKEGEQSTLETTVGNIYSSLTAIKDYFISTEKEGDESIDGAGFDTGGYTGAWGSTGKLAILHEKELVLNKEDTVNMLELVGTLRDLRANNILSGNTGIQGLSQKAQVVDQNVHIEANFPNVSSSEEIKSALIDLVNQTVQYTGIHNR